ncbi:MAG: P1 family peptidase [Thermoanaerobaculales bacterium]
MIRLTAALLLLMCSLPCFGADEDRPRLRDLGIAPGVLDPGPLNAITDVAGVRVGHRTLIDGKTTRTGITAVLPHGGNLFQSKVAAGVFPANAFGKAAGFLQVSELGNIESPIVLTNTLCVGAAVQAVVEAILNSLLKATSVTGYQGHTREAFPIDRLREMAGSRKSSKSFQSDAAQ